MAQADGRPLIEGVSGTGDAFMVGRRPPEDLPPAVARAVRETYEQAAALFGAARFEWVHDGAAVWIVQLHSGASASTGAAIYPGDATCYHPFEIEKGLDALRNLVAQVQGIK